MGNMPIGISCKGGKKKELGVCKNFQEDTHKKKKKVLETLLHNILNESMNQFRKWWFHPLPITLVFDYLSTYVTNIGWLYGCNSSKLAFEQILHLTDKVYFKIQIVLIPLLTPTPKPYLEDKLYMQLIQNVIFIDEIKLYKHSNRLYRMHTLEACSAYSSQRQIFFF